MKGEREIHDICRLTPPSHLQKDLHPRLPPRHLQDPSPHRVRLGCPLYPRTELEERKGVTRTRIRASEVLGAEQESC